MCVYNCVYVLAITAAKVRHFSESKHIVGRNSLSKKTHLHIFI